MIDSCQKGSTQLCFNAEGTRVLPAQRIHACEVTLTPSPPGYLPWKGVIRKNHFTRSTRTPMWVTAKLIWVPSPSLAGWGRMPYISSFLAMSRSCTSDSAGVLPLKENWGGQQLRQREGLGCGPLPLHSTSMCPSQFCCSQFGNWKTVSSQLSDFKFRKSCEMELSTHGSFNFI